MAETELGIFLGHLRDYLLADEYFKEIKIYAKGSNYFQLSLSDSKNHKTLASNHFHFEIIVRDRIVYIENHWEGLSENDFLLREHVELDASKYEWFDWQKGKSIRNKKTFTISETNFNKIKDALVEMYTDLNDKIVEVNNLLPKDDIKSIRSKGVWIFQGNPQKFPVIEYLKNNTNVDWSVNQSWKLMNIGDIVYFWVSGVDSGIYAIGEIISSVKELEDENGRNERKVDIRISKFLGANYLPRHKFIEDEILKDAGIITFANATNYKLKNSELKQIEILLYGDTNSNIISFYKFSPQDLSKDGNLIEWMEENIIKLPVSGKIGDVHLYKTKEELLQEIGLKNENDEIWNLWSFKSAQIGDVIFLSQPVGVSGGIMTSLGIGIIRSEYYYDESEVSQFKHKRSVQWITDKKYLYKANTIPEYPEMFRGGVFTRTKIGPEILYEYLRMYPELLEIFRKNGLNSILPQTTPTPSSKPMNPSMSLNTILFGVPGTGKTYNTINYALSIIEQKPIQELLNEDRQELNRRYNEYKEKGQIVFTTFHQSFGYEEFIEGLRANTDDSGNIIYSIENGIFKNLAKKAKENLLSSMHPTQVRKDFHEVLDMVLKGVNEGNPLEIQMVQTSFKIYDYNDRTIYFEKALGGRNHTLSIKTLEGMYNTKSNSIIKGGLNVYYAPLVQLCLEKEGEMVSHLQEGQIITSDRAEYTIVKVGSEIIEIQSNKGDDRGRILIPREIVQLLVERIQKNEITLEDIKNKPLDGIDTYIQGYRSELKAIVKAQLQSTEVVHEKPKNYVLIIDEINRGNISKIFGELITLIEDTKRIGNREATSVILPNSQEEFGVPNNLYILGTMNTADRSIALMDIALRRRFTFKEIKPNVDLLAGIWVGKIDIQKLFETLNKRIEYLFDRDHVIGHSFFLPLKTDASLERLNQIFENNIIPLLQEYFYEDWEKIQIIFGDHKEQGLKNERDTIIHSEVSSEIEILGFNHDDIIDEKSSFRLNENPTENSYIGIYQRVNE